MRIAETRTPVRTVAMTREDAEKWSRCREGPESTRRMASVRDEDFDTSDIPEVKDFSRFARLIDHPEHPLYAP